MTNNRWTFLVDGTARAGIEASLVSLVEPGMKLLIVRAGRFGLLLSEIAQRIGAEIVTLDIPWGEVATLEQIEDALTTHRPHVLACIHGDTSTTVAQPLDGVGALCRKYGVLSYVDTTATLGGMEVATDRWGVDVVSSGLQKCMGGPPGSAPSPFPTVRRNISSPAAMSRPGSVVRIRMTARACAFLELFRPGHDYGLLV